jgi:hypothetical protein
MTAFETFMNSAQKGEMFEYYRGFLARDTGMRKFNDSTGDRTTAPRNGAMKIADEVWAASQQGLVSLAQRRVTKPERPDGIGAFAYFAQKR